MRQPVEQRGVHLGAAKHARPLGENFAGGDHRVGTGVQFQTVFFRPVSRRHGHTSKEFQETFFAPSAFC